MQAPPISEVRQINLPPVKKHQLPNGIPVTYLHDHLAEYVKIELVIEAGRHHEIAKLTSKATALLMKEGSRSFSGKEISRIFDSKGSTLNIRTTLDHTYLSFTCIMEYATELLEVLADLCLYPTFDQKEIDKYKKRQARKLDIELRKTEVVAYREMTALIYGENTPYGYNSDRQLYESLRREDVLIFHDARIKKGVKHIFIAGHVTDLLLETVENRFGCPDFTPSKSLASIPIEVTHLDKPVVAHYDMPNAVQSSIRLFRPLFTRMHEDYPEMFLLSIVFGGYFGSRLMKNIREDEGLTYGIYTSLDTLQHSGYLYISTETRHENVGKVLGLINDEMNKLCNEVCSEEELLMVKRYIAGQFLRMIDGPLNVIKVYRTLALDGLPDQYYNELLDQIWRCSAEDLRGIALNYLKPDQYSLATVGKIISDHSK